VNDVGTCRSCKGPIEWALSPKKHRIPLELTGCRPDADGAQFLVTDQVGQVWAYGLRVLAERVAEREQIGYDRAVLLVKTRYQARLSHFAACPNADRHRKRARR
jgi:hypothetical protein